MSSIYSIAVINDNGKALSNAYARRLAPGSTTAYTTDTYFADENGVITPGYNLDDYRFDVFATGHYTGSLYAMAFSGQWEDGSQMVSSLPNTLFLKLTRKTLFTVIAEWFGFDPAKAESDASKKALRRARIVVWSLVGIAAILSAIYGMKKLKSK